MRAEWVLGSIQQIILGVDNDWRLSYLNPLAERVLGSSHQLLDLPLLSAIPLRTTSGGTLSLSTLKELADNGEVTAISLAVADDKDTSRSLAVQHVHDESGTHMGYSVFVMAPELSLPVAVESHLDHLTELMGRREFERRVDNLVNDAATSSRTHALLYIDIDQFKLINDTSGHGAGDNLIKMVAERLNNELFTGDMLCRLGGDEFGVLLSNVDTFEARSTATRLVKAVKRMNFIWSGISHRVSISIGVVQIDQHTLERQTVMSQADVAMYSAKENGRGRVHVYDTQDKKLSRLHNEMDWVHRINQALSNDDFVLVRERICVLHDTEGKAPSAFYEILVRMRYMGELLRPGQFMPAAERFGLMPQIDRWVIKAFFEYLQSNPHLKDENVLFSLNISGQSLCQDSFLEFVYRQLRRSYVNPNTICFEITETVAVTNFEPMTRFISRVHELGGRFALDDFGTGMSSFGYLQELPVDFVKIDGLFVHDMDKNPVHEAMVRSINDISHVLGKKTIAEFVEREAVVERLKDVGVDFSQGYLYGRPEPLSEVLVDRHSAE